MGGVAEYSDGILWRYSAETWNSLDFFRLNMKYRETR